MNWYLLQKLDKNGEAGKDSLTRHSCFEIRACTELWHSNKFIVDELSARGLQPAQPRVGVAPAALDGFAALERARYRQISGFP